MAEPLAAAADLAADARSMYLIKESGHLDVWGDWRKVNNPNAAKPQYATYWYHLTTKETQWTHPAHHEVIRAARERHEAVHALAMLSATAEEATDKTCAQLKLEAKIAGLKEKFKGAADAVGPGGLAPLLLACTQGRAGDVTALLALGADPAIEGDVSDILQIRSINAHLSCSPHGMVMWRF